MFSPSTSGKVVLPTPAPDEAFLPAGWLEKKHSLVQRLVFTVAVIALASFLRVVFFEDLGRSIPYLVYYPAVMLIALYGGFSMGILSGLLATAVTYFWIQGGKVISSEAIALAVFAASCVMVSLVGEACRRSIQRTRSIQRNADGTTEALHAEIVTRKSTQENLSEMEDRLRFAMEGAGLGAWNWNPTSGSFYCSDHAKILFGFPAEAEPGYQDFLAALHPGDRLPTDRTLKAAQENRENFRLTFRIVWPDGSVHHIAAKGRGAYAKESGKPIGIAGIVEDVTELTTARFDLLESQESLRSTLDAAKIGYWSLDLVTHSATRSLRHDQIFGYQALLPEWTYDIFLKHVHPDDRSVVDQQFRAGVESRTLWEFECRILQRDGSLRWIWVHGNVFCDEDGQAVRMLGIVNDITHRKHDEEKIRNFAADLEKLVAARTAALEDANRELEAFTYSVSHDLRAPLRAIDAFSRMVIEDSAPRLDDEAKRQLGVVRSEACRMGRLIDDLLAFSRIGRRELKDEEVDMDALVQVCTDENRNADHGASQPVFDIHPLPPSHGDPIMFRQIWANLISNAVKFSSREAKPLITITGTRDAAATTYCVRDNGVGFDQRYAAKLFGVFQRLHTTEEFEGSGVGLAIVQRIVLRHGGTIRAESELNHGAAFFFSLPNKKQT